MTEEQQSAEAEVEDEAEAARSRMERAFARLGGLAQDSPGVAALVDSWRRVLHESFGLDVALDVESASASGDAEGEQAPETPQSASHAPDETGPLSRD